MGREETLFEWVRGMYQNMDEADKREAERFFPELTESKDERIRKEIIGYLNSRVPTAEETELLYFKRWIAWLEKQKEYMLMAKEPVEQKEQTITPEMMEMAADEALWGEQKPAEPSDEELQRHQDELYNFKVFAAKQAKEHHISFVHDFEWNNFCAELLSYFNMEQKPAEWSEEDEDNIRAICSYLDSYIRTHEEDGYGVEECKYRKSWLKSLHPQPKEDLNIFKKNMALSFGHYLDEHRSEDKMCISNSEWEDISQAFVDLNWGKIIRYAEKYQPKQDDRYMEGYQAGYAKAIEEFNKHTSYHFPVMPTTPSVFGCDGTHCTNPHMDCINCPRKGTGGNYTTTPNTATTTGTQWKPSEEQMKALKTVADNLIPTAEPRTTIYSLYNDLKTLINGNG